MGKCNVCGKEAETVVCCSSCGAISFAYCPECLNAGREPYDAIVGMGLTSDMINKSYKNEILLPSLKFFGKTLQEFDADVEKIDEEYYNWLQHQDESAEEKSEVEGFE